MPQPSLMSGRPRPQVVIVGGGFGGLNAARALADALVQVTVLDCHNYHLFPPLLYQPQEARHTAQNTRLSLEERPYLPFHYADRGVLATIGRAEGVASFGRLSLSGFIAWLAWLFIHIWFLIGFRNRVAVLFDWVWSYFTYQRAGRLITGRSVGRRYDRSSTDLPSSDCNTALGGFVCGQ